MLFITNLLSVILEKRKKKKKKEFLFLWGFILSNELRIKTKTKIQPKST